MSLDSENLTVVAEDEGSTSHTCGICGNEGLHRLDCFYQGYVDEDQVQEPLCSDYHSPGQCTIM